MINIAEGIVGRKKNDSKYDFYETPSWSTELIIDRLLKDNVLQENEQILEPCCGAGAISKVLEDKGFEVYSSDIQEEDFIYGENGVDVYKLPDGICRTIITNPPYNMMTKNNMLEQFLRISNEKVILLLNIYYLSSTERYEMLKNSHLQYVYVHSERVTMYPYGEEKPKSSGTKMFAWFVWNKKYNGEPIIRWVSKKQEKEK